MNGSRARVLSKPVAAVALLLTVTACATSNGNPESFGTIDQSLQRVELQGGEVAFGWVSPALSGRGYDRALLAPVAFPPLEREPELIHPNDLAALGDELNDRLLRAVLPRVAMRDTPGSDTLRFRLALTGLRVPLNNEDYLGLTQGEPLYPVASATGESVDRFVYLLVEMEVSDSVHGTVLARTLRRGPAIVLATDQRQVGISQLQPLLDTWVAQWAASITQLVRGRDTDAASLFAATFAETR
ncbi:MAG: DUF3313 family protein [Halioglobus sp.]|nr:DUF3313 family protein [Halioglobus sp.]